MKEEEEDDDDETWWRFVVSAYIFPLCVCVCVSFEMDDIGGLVPMNDAKDTELRIH